MTLFTHKYGELTLGEEIASGGEGTVYKVIGHSDLAIKLYNPSHCTETMEKKIRAMVRKGGQLSLPVQNQTRRQYFTSWPLDSVKDEKGCFRGFVMPYFANTHSIICACRKSERKQLLKNYDYSDSIILAMNLANEVAYLHQQGIVVGDLNWKNIGFTNQLSVVLFDADSFTFSADDGTLYKTRGGFCGLLPPELLGLDLSLDSSVFTRASDNFQLAILIWCLLMDNYHPFVNRGFNIGRMSSSTPSVDINIARGVCPCLDGREDLMPQGCPNYKQRIFLKSVRDGFEQTFRYDGFNALDEKTIAKRTTASQWVTLMNKFLVEYLNQKPVMNDETAAPAEVTLKTTMQPYLSKEANEWQDAFEQAENWYVQLGEFLIGSLVLLIGFDLLSRDSLLIPMLSEFGLLHELDFLLEFRLILTAAAHATPIAYGLDQLNLSTFWMLVLWIIVLIICFFFAIHHYALF